MAVDYYEILGVSPEATSEEIKRAYRRLARQYHPDVNGGAPEDAEHFKRVSEAYAVLSDERRRRQYDHGARGVGDLFDGGFPDLFEIFESAFGGGSFSGRPRAGRSLELTLTLSLEEVLSGVSREVTYTRPALCSHCSGEGLEPGTGFRVCSTCHGQGRVQRTVNTWLGSMTSVQPCPACAGQGRLAEQPCSQCRGERREQREEHRTVEIPPGVEHGDEVVVRGAGEEIPGARPGDLILRLLVSRHPRFARQGRDLATEHEVHYLQALLGDTLRLPTLTGEVEVPLPPGTQPGARLEVPGEGLPPRGGGTRGRLLVTLQVRLPDRLTPRERELLEELAAGADLDLRPPGKGLFDRLRESLGGS